MSCQTSDQPQVITIQMNLCLSLRELLVASSMRAWLYCGLAIRQAQALRMRMEYNQRHDLQQQEIRRRTFWACIIMDRLVALCTFRTQTIDPGLVTIHLPASDVAFAFGHHSYGPRLDELGASPGYKTSSGSLIALPDGQPLNLRSYWIKTTVLWGYILSDYVDYGRRNFTLPPLEGPYGDHSRAIQNWCATLPVEMRWSEANLRAHRSLGQAALFAEMHILLAHARFLVQHEYLPQIHEPATATHHRPSADIPLVPGYDRAGIAFTHVDDLVIQVCVDGAFEVVDLMRVVQANNVQCTIGMGVALVTACSVLLWVVDCSRQATRGVPFDHIDHTRAEQSISYLLSVLDSGFPRHWRLSKTWASSIRLLNRFYQAHYHSVTQSETAVESSGDIDTDIAADRREDDGGEQRSTMLQIGDGLPDISMIPDGLYYKARLITGLSMEMPDLLYRKFLRQQMQPPRETRTETAATSEDAATVAETITEMPSTDDSTADFWPLDLDVMLEVDFAFLTSLDVDNDPATWTTIRGEN
ncbi:hypothetical protein HMPREF1624_02964 [Sporothrix schenckii ATCC 58251]|uniref:Xylanolytic transcriptional activator regulatory domain-containing protein n=1 Tax=Sporothrix schenckii (strain ATCC 58251 / de Perez 2211183) TaxID=1391915 RepID=U7PXY8_SPOS1|nr:hypothetical protein HMPREF1624_02964 [Sporothrix schenckii ATCC 58251]